MNTKSLRDKTGDELTPGLYVNLDSLSYSFFEGEYSNIGWPRFKSKHGFHSPSPYAISKYWTKVTNPEHFVKGLRNDADWIEQELALITQHRTSALHSQTTEQNSFSDTEPIPRDMQDPRNATSDRHYWR